MGPVVLSRGDVLVHIGIITWVVAEWVPGLNFEADGPDSRLGLIEADAGLVPILYVT